MKYVDEFRDGRLARQLAEEIAREFGKLLVVAGFEPLDVLQAILMVVRQIAEARAEVENQYRRVVDMLVGDPLPRIC